MQNYLVFQPVFKYYEALTDNDRVIELKYKSLSGESIKTPATSGNSLNLTLDYIDNPKKK